MRLAEPKCGIQTSFLLRWSILFTLSSAFLKLILFTFQRFQVDLFASHCLLCYRFEFRLPIFEFLLFRHRFIFGAAKYGITTVVDEVSHPSF